MKKVLLILTLGFFMTTVAVASNPLSSGKTSISNEKQSDAFSNVIANLSTEKMIDPTSNLNAKENVDCGFPVYYQDDYFYGEGYLDCNGYTGSNIDFWNWFINLFF